MARIKKAKKMIKVHARKTLRSVKIKSEVKSRFKKAASSLGAENLAEIIKTAIIKADKAASKKIIHKNKAARIKSKLMKKLHKAKTSASA